MKTAAKVELHQGYWWTCDECGRDVHGNAELDLPAEQIAEMFVKSGMELPREDEDLAFLPQRVKCPHCDSEFEVED